MSIKLETRKVLKDGVPHREILSFEALHKSQLPSFYLYNSPCVFLEITFHFVRLVITHASGDKDYLRIKGLILEERYQEIVQTMKEAGMILHKINKELRKKYPEHFAQKKEIVKI